MVEPEKKVDESWKNQIDREKKQTEHEEQKDASKGARASQTGFPPIQASFATLVTELAMQASLFLGLASLAFAGYVEIGGTGNSWSQKPWCGY